MGTRLAAFAPSVTAMGVVRFVACFCLVIAPAVATELALNDQGLDTRAVCSLQELSTRLLNSFCEHGQPLVDRLAVCGADSLWSQLSRAYVLLCRTNERGMQCGDFVIATATNLLPTSPFAGSGYQYIQAVITDCFPYIGTCQPACRDAITALRNNLGCCAEFFSATFGGTFSQVASAINYTFWRSCGVEDPAACDSSLSLPSVEQETTCNTEEILNFMFENFYCGRGGQAFLDSVSHCDLADAGLNFRPQDVCASNDNGNFCYDYNIITELLTIASSPMTRLACGNNQCTPECSSILQRLTNSTFGCCVNNILNHSDPVPLIQFQYITNYELWSACGFDTPGFCRNSLLQFNSVSQLKGATAVVFTLVIMLVLL